MNRSAVPDRFAVRRKEFRQKLGKNPKFIALLRFYRSFSVFGVIGFSTLLTVLLCGSAAYFALRSDVPHEALLNHVYRDMVPTRYALSPAVFKAAFPGGESMHFDFLLYRGTGIHAEHTATGIEDEPLKTRIREEDAVTVPEDLYAFDRALVPAGEHAVVPMDLSLSPQNGEILFSNATGFSPDGSAHRDAAYPISPYRGADQDAPVVLVLHTHATETYLPEGAISYADANAETRTEDTARSVVAVGDVLCEVLNGMGIPTLHCTTLFDAEDFQGAYDAAARVIRAYVAEYPTLRYVFDVHRDALCRENGDEIKPVTLVDGKRSAQIMIVVGTNEAGANHPRWEDHLTVAAHLQARLNARYPGLARPINLRSAAFNEQYTEGSLLLEIGAFGNTLTEAKTAVRALGSELGAMILEGN